MVLFTAQNFTSILETVAGENQKSVKDKLLEEHIHGNLKIGQRLIRMSKPSFTPKEAYILR